MHRTSIRTTGMAMALAAMMEGAQRVLPDNRPRLPNPPAITGMTTRQKEKMRRAGENEANRLANRRQWKQRRNLRSAAETRFHALVNKLTNRERNQWAKAGYPGFHEKDPAALRPFFRGYRFEYLTGAPIP